MKAWMRLALALLALGLVGAGSYLGYDYYTGVKDERALQALARQVEAVLQRQAGDGAAGDDVAVGAEGPVRRQAMRLTPAKVELMLSPASAGPRPQGAAKRTDANGIPLPIAEGVALAAEKPELGGMPVGMDADGLVRVVEACIAQDLSFANPAIEQLRLRIDPPAGEAGPKVSASVSGTYLRANPELTELEGAVSAWLKGQGYRETTLQVLDLKVQIEMPVLEQYAELYSQNRDMIGWIQIERTMVNYPVMQTPTDPEFYLRANFKREYAYSGLPFLDARNDPYDATQNLIVYGHNMKSGTMFGTLSSYESKGYWEQHKRIQFSLLTEAREYEIIGAYHSKEYEEGETGFKYYENVSLKDAASYAAYVKNVKEASFYDTGIEPQWGEQLLTLSTCSYHTDHGMFVVVARRVK